MLSELNDKLRTVFEDIVTKARSGYWLHELVFSATIGRNRYRIPPRAVVGGLETIEIADAVGGAYYEIEQVPASSLCDYEGTPGRPGQPRVYAVIGDQVELVPTPTTAIPLKFVYYIRPSQLYPSQNSVSGTDRGRIVGINIGARTLTTNVAPFDMSLAVPAAVTSGLQRIDVVHSDGWHELSLVNAGQSLSGGSVFTVLGTDDLSDIEVGDYVRVVDQTDWPCLPDDFHRCLCDATAVKLLVELHLLEKSQALAENNGNDLARFRSLLYPRVKAAPKQVGIMRRSRGAGFGSGFRYS